jgi:hypothetical protein
MGVAVWETLLGRVHRESQKPPMQRRIEEYRLFADSLGSGGVDKVFGGLALEALILHCAAIGEGLTHQELEKAWGVENWPKKRV